MLPLWPLSDLQLKSFCLEVVLFFRCRAGSVDHGDASFYIPLPAPAMACYLPDSVDLVELEDVDSYFYLRRASPEPLYHTIQKVVFGLPNVEPGF